MTAPTRIRNLLCASIVFVVLIAVRVCAEEPQSQLLTVLSSDTLSGSIFTAGSLPCVASNAHRALQSGLYSAGPVSFFGEQIKLALVVFPDGNGYCETGNIGPYSGSLRVFATGSFTNRSNGLLNGKFEQNKSRFSGRVTADHDSARVTLILRQRGITRMRHVRLERVASLVPQASQALTSVVASWAQLDPSAAAQWVQTLPDGLIGNRDVALTEIWRQTETGAIDREAALQEIRNQWLENHPGAEWILNTPADSEALRRALLEAVIKLRESHKSLE